MEILSIGADGILEMEKIEHIFENLGVSERKPVSTPFLDFAKLNQKTIRFFNKLIKYIAMNFATIDPLISSIVKVLEIETDDGQTELVEYVDQKELCTILREKKILNEYDLGENYEEVLIFLSIDPDYSLDKLMVRKLRVALKKVRESKYCSYIGAELRQKKDESDDE